MRLGKIITLKITRHSKNVTLETENDKCEKKVISFGNRTTLADKNKNKMNCE